MKQARELAWWSAGQLGALEARMGEAWLQWHRDWLGELPQGARVACANAHEADATRHAWQSVSAAQDGVWIADLQHARALVAHELTGESEPAQDAVAAQLAGAAWAAALSTMQPWLASAEVEAVPGGALFEPWSGAVVAQLPLGTGAIALLLDASAVTRLAPVLPQAATPLPRLHPLGSAVHAGTARLSVELTECAITLGDLHGLAIGDVLRLDHELTRPLALRLDGATLCNARLGRRGIAKAVALAPLHEAAEA